MDDSEKVIKGLELCEIGSGDRCYETECPYYEQGCTESLKNDILELLKGQDSEESRILKIVWDVLHSTVSVDTEADQDYVYELIRNQVRPMY